MKDNKDRDEVLAAGKEDGLEYAYICSKYIKIEDTINNKNILVTQINDYLAG